VGAFPSYSVYVRLAAATGDFGIEAGTLFLIQFWQFHFWAIGWFYMKIMKRQVFMLPTGKR
jgi:protoheme IX farnesyltransferase